MHRGERELNLTVMEFRLLEFLLRHPRQVLSRGTIFDRVWGFDLAATSNSLTVYIGYLRRKTEAGGEPRLIHTVRGMGTCCATELLGASYRVARILIALVARS